MKYLFDVADRYLQKSDWKDLALLKFCLFSMGLMAGAQIPKKHKNLVQISALGVFLATYIPLMAKLFAVMTEKSVEESAQ